LDNKTPKILFYDGLEITGLRAICLFWCDEIHISKKYQKHPLLPDIIQHELKHYRLAKEIQKANFWRALILSLYNNLWDLYDCLRLDIKIYALWLKKILEKIWRKKR